MSYAKIITRENGDSSRVLFTNYALPGCEPEIGIDVFTKKVGEKNWTLCVQSPEERKASMAMSRDDYIKHGRHPMFSAFTTGELLKASIEAKRFGYNNPEVEGSLHFTTVEGKDVTTPVPVSTATGMIGRGEPFENIKEGHYLKFGKMQFKVESNSHQQCRITDLPVFQMHVTHHLLSLEKNAERSHGPS
ncbi:hypothetical protein RYA05_03195 [Pseudomonas syringae pv. actinidiae]|nr:hypothetical protein [Pseudomonas syringae pv. actinidiae]